MTKPPWPHWEWNSYIQSYQPPRFRGVKGADRRRVRGGRWEVRNLGSNLGLYKVRKPWQARTTGAASHLNRRFMTQPEAVSWAQKVATVYAMPTGPEKDEAYFQLRVEKYGDKHIIKGTFPDRPRRPQRHVSLIGI